MPLAERLFEQKFWTAEIGLLAAGDRLDVDYEGAAAQIQRDVEAGTDIEWAPVRWQALNALLESGSPSADALKRYAADYGIGGVRPFPASDGTKIYQLKLETFPGHINNVYVLMHGDERLLWDVGSGADSSMRDFERTFHVLQTQFGESVGPADLSTVVISHGHLDHYGGAGWIREQAAKATLMMHELDRRVVELFEERLAVATRDVSRYFTDVGVPEDEVDEFMEMYTATKDVFRRVAIDHSLTDNERIGKGWKVVHVPGHCPGLICLLVGDVMLAADHILARITPLQSPEVITPYTGLGHYFESLIKVRTLSDVRLTLPAHETPITNLPQRVDEIAAHHHERLEQVRELCAEPLTIHEISDRLFGSRDGYARILAVLEAGAHVEYLFLRGGLQVANPRRVAETDEAIRYVKSGS